MSHRIQWANDAEYNELKTCYTQQQTLPRVNLEPTNQDYAIFLPSISTFYQSFISKQHWDEFVPQSRLPKQFENGVEGLNFLNKEQGYFYYPWALYSAGHAHLDLTKSQTAESMIHRRNKQETFILGDSGGFQIGKGLIKFDWEHFYEQEGDATYIGRADKTRLAILNWLEATTDYAMVLDLPSWSADPVNSQRTGLKDFADCLKGTLFNNDFFVKHRQHKTKLLNVLQGENEHDADIWYNAVKHYNFDGWAMGGLNARGTKLILRRLIELRDSGLLESGRDLMHFLGVGSLEHAIFYTAIQREIKKFNPNFKVTFDCSSPFLSVSKGQIYSQHIHTNKEFRYAMEVAPDNRDLVGSTLPFPWSSPIGNRLVMGDICRLGPGVPNKTGKVGATSWDSFAYALMMGHNVYQHIESVQRANALTDIACTSIRPNPSAWDKKIKPLDPFVPTDIISMVELVKQVFASDNPISLINNNTKLLHSIDGKSNKLNNRQTYTTLFE